MQNPPTNPKKQALMPSGPLRRQLRAAGHALRPVVQVGKDGLSDAVLRQVSSALTAHELVKVKMGSECPEDRISLAEKLASLPDAQLAQQLGHTVLVYRRNPDIAQFEP